MKYGVWLLVTLVVVSYSPAEAVNQAAIDIVRSGSELIPADTIYVGGDYELRNYELRIFIENDFDLFGIALTFIFWTEDGASWIWTAQPDGIGPMRKCVTVNTESRLYPPNEIFDMTSLLVTEEDVDQVNPDIIAVGGVAMEQGLKTGPLEHMISIHFKATGLWNPSDIMTLCVDSGTIPCKSNSSMPCDDRASFVFVNEFGEALIPIFKPNRMCWPVKLLCGNPNGDNDVNVGDAVFMINHVFRDGPAPDPWWLGDANCDGTLDVGDIVFLIAASFRYGPQPECCE